MQSTLSPASSTESDRFPGSMDSMKIPHRRCCGVTCNAGTFIHVPQFKLYQTNPVEKSHAGNLFSRSAQCGPGQIPSPFPALVFESSCSFSHIATRPSHSWLRQLRTQDRRPANPACVCRQESRCYCSDDRKARDKGRALKHPAIL